MLYFRFSTTVVYQNYRCLIFISALGGLDLEELGIPTVEEVVRTYCQRAGIPPIDNWDWYVVFGLFRMAAIIQGVYKRALQGESLYVFGLGIYMVRMSDMYNVFVL